jgi:Mn2+/Fe2+ NRAMP family transporter
MFLADTNWSDFVRGLKPSIPPTGNAALLIAGMIGTTMAAIVLISRSVLVQEKGWTASDFKTEHRDAFVSVTLMFVINAAIVASAAGTMYVNGLRIDRAIDMVKTLEPLAGEFAVLAFVVGIVSAALSSLFPNFLLGPWLLCDYMGVPRNLKSTRLRVLVLATASVGFVVPIFGGSPVPIMIASQAISPLVMPLIVALVTIMLLRKDIVGEHKNGFLMNAGLGITLVFCLYILYLSVVGFIGEAG